MNLLEQKRVWDGDEENIGVFSTPADSCSSEKGNTDIPQVSLGTEALLEQLMDRTDVFTNGKPEREKEKHPSPQTDAQ